MRGEQSVERQSTGERAEPKVARWLTLVGRSVRRSRVVDQKVEDGRSLLELLDESVASGLGANVGDDVETFTRTFSGEPLGDLLQLLLLPRRNVDGRAVLDEGGSEHFTQPTPSARDEGNLAGDIEEVGDVLHWRAVRRCVTTEGSSRRRGDRWSETEDAGGRVSRSAQEKAGETDGKKKKRESISGLSEFEG